jgi:hypothetical protein
LLLMLVPLAMLAAVSAGQPSLAEHPGRAPDLDLTLNLVPQSIYPHAKCMDGTPPVRRETLFHPVGSIAC